MILVDTSVWISHFRENNDYLVSLLDDNKVLSHPYVIGELACGNLRNRTNILNLMNKLPSALIAEPDEIMHFIEFHRLMGRGIGYVDVCLLASARLTNAQLWSLDKRLQQSASLLALNYEI